MSKLENIHALSGFRISSDHIFLGHQYDAKISVVDLLFSPPFVTDDSPLEERPVLSLGGVMAQLLTGQSQRLSTFQKLIREGVMPTSPASSMGPGLVDPGVEKDWPLALSVQFASLVRCALEEDRARRPSIYSLVGMLEKVLQVPHGLCTVCCCNAANAQIQCGHSVLCKFCSDYARERGDGCPVCRAPINSQPGIPSKVFVPAS